MYYSHHIYSSAGCDQDISTLAFLIPEVCVAFVVLLRAAFLCWRRLNRFFHRLVPEAHVSVVGVTPDTAGV